MPTSWNFELVYGPRLAPIAGLAWDGAAMLFSDMGADAIMRYDPREGKASIARKYANRTFGIAFGPEGELFACQEGGRRVVRMMPVGSSSVTATRLEGRVHNHPRFIALDAQGRAWFSDRHHPIPAPHLELHGELDHQSVLRLTHERSPRPHAWHVERMTYDTQAPTGVAIAPDGATLYVGENDERTSGKRELRAYRIRADGTLGEPIVLHTFGADSRGVHRGAEGMCIDAAGCVFVCAGSAASGPGSLVYVFSPKGAVQATYAVPQGTPLNCAFGDDGLTSLYVSTLEGHLYRVRDTGHAGHALFTGRI